MKALCSNSPASRFHLVGEQFVYGQNIFKELFAVRGLKIKNNLFPHDKELVSAVKLIFEAVDSIF